MPSLVRFSLKVSALALISVFAVSSSCSASEINLTSLKDSLRQRQPQGTLNQILQNSSDSISQEKQHFAHAILQAVQAEPNQVERTQRSLNTFLTQGDLTQELASTLNMLLPRLLQPEALVLKDHERHFLSNPSPTPAHPALIALNKILQELTVLTSTVPPSLQPSLRDLQNSADRTPQSRF